MTRSARFPTGTPYVGPTMCYDNQIEPDQLLRRLAYGRAAPLLKHRDRLDADFYGRLLDGLANAHVVLVKAAASEKSAHYSASRIKAELPPERFSISVMEDPEHEEWMVLAYNNVPMELRRLPMKYVERGPNWIGIAEVARVLQVSKDRARAVVLSSPVKTRRTGGRMEIMMRQRDLPILVNRPRRWRKRRRRKS